MTKNSLGIPFLCKINEPQTIHIMKVRFLYLLCLLTCILPACSSDDNEPVDEPVTITGVSVSPESISLECGETKQLTAKISPENATAGDITWTSSDEAIATVSSDGTVTGISKGTTTVTATVSGKSGTCEVTVTQEVQSVEISPATATLTSKGETIQLTATVLPEGAGEATWTSSDEAVATVSPEGIVTAIGEGTATITATAGEKTATCTITVSISIVDIEGNQATFHLDGASAAQVSQAISEAAQAGVTRFILTGDSEALGLYDGNPFSGIQIELLDLSGVTGWQDRDANGLPELPAESFRHTSSSDFSGLQEVILPQEIQQLQDYAFYKCSNLTKITAPGVSEFKTNLIAMITQVGYAIGLLFIVPLGDLYQRKKIILTNFTLLIFSLIAIGAAPDIYIIWGASLITGICSMIPQIFVPIASQFSRPENKGRNVGIVISGLLTGILASRVVSGFVGEVLGWREMYFIAAGMMLLCAIAVLKILPDIQPTFRGKYGDLMKSLFSLIKDYPSLRIYSIRAGIAFGSFLAMWSCLAFKMGQAPFYADSDVIGILGLCGIAGASTASLVGKYVKKVGIRNFNFIGCGLILLAWASLYFCGNTYAGIIAGVLLIDIGMQCIQLSNQTSIFDICPSASNRVNTIFMTTYFTGGSLGTFLAGSCWQIWGWAGVAGIGTVLTLLSLLITICHKEQQHALFP